MSTLSKIQSETMRGSEIITLEQLRPQLVCRVFDRELGELGVLVIDRTVGSHISGGGIRLASGLTAVEVALLARSMTLKYAFLNLPTGGAKAGITVGEPLISTRRRDVLAAFGRALSPLVKKKVYFLGEDLGTTTDDINAIHEAIGLPAAVPETDTPSSTASTVFEAIRQCVRHRGLEFGKLTAAVEGCGRIGSELAWMLATLGAKVVALSTEEGAIHNPAGLDVNELLSSRATYGNGFVHHFVHADPMDPADLFSLDVDLLLPCARTGSIHADNAAGVGAKIIVPAANAAVTRGAEAILHERGILYFPDFVANCGAVLRSRMVQSLGLGVEPFREVVNGAFARKVARLLALADERGVHPAKLAREVAWRSFRRLRDEALSDAKRPKPRGLLAGARRRATSVLRRRLLGPLARGVPGLGWIRRRGALARFAADLEDGLVSQE